MTTAPAPAPARYTGTGIANTLGLAAYMQLDCGLTWHKTAASDTEANYFFNAPSQQVWEDCVRRYDEGQDLVNAKQFAGCMHILAQKADEADKRGGVLNAANYLKTPVAYRRK